MVWRYPEGLRERLIVMVCAGSSVRAAARAVGVAPQTGRDWWRSWGRMDLVMRTGCHGGLATAGALCTVSGDHRAEGASQRRPLTLVDRTVIGICLRPVVGPLGDSRPGMSMAEIGRRLGRSTSVISREVGRNSGEDGVYRAVVADRAACQRRRRPKEFKLKANPGLCGEIEALMDAGWSPRLIATILRRDHPHMIMDRVCAETIYQALYVQTRGQLRKDLYRQLNLKRAARKPRSGSRRHTSPYREAFTIRDRPAEVEDRAVPGHWEGDLVMGASCRSAVGTLVERSTRFTILLHLPDRHDAATVAEAMIREMRDLPGHLRRSLTWDRGVELAEYREISLQLDMPVYFCDPRSPWQRGSNENTNRLLRFWLEKGTDLSVHTATDLRRIATTLNARPRPTLGLKTPAQALEELLANQAAA